MKRILKASAAFALATTLIFSGAGMASATDEATPAPEVSAEVQAPAETSTVEEAVVTDPVAAPAPAEAVEAPVVETAPAEPQAEVVTTDAQPQAPPVAAKTAPKVSYVTVLWEGTDIQWPKDGQTLVGSVKHDDKALNKGWIDSHKFKPCTTYQGDLYVDDATTAALLKGGKLYGANNPKESWPDGAYQGSYSVVFKTDCAPALIEIPYPKLLANEVCGADNDTVYTDPAWVEQYGHLVNGPWIDTKYKTINGKRVVDGSAQIKAEFRKTHIWAGTAGTTASDFTRWQMYPGTAAYTHEDTATVCPPIEVGANPKASITAVCGAADITLTNPQNDGEANKTASFVVNVDGKFYGAYAVVANGSETVKLTFPEDSGDHVVEVFQAGTSEWKSIAKATVSSDCIAPEVVPPVFKDITCEEPGSWSIPSVEGVNYLASADGETWFHIGSQSYPVTDALIGTTVYVKAVWIAQDKVLGEWEHTFTKPTEEQCTPVVVPPVTETPKPTPAPSVTPSPETGSLAATGGELPVVITVGAVLALVIGGAVLLLSRRKKIDEVVESVDAE